MSGTSSISPFSGLYAYCVNARVTRFMISVESVKYARVGSRVAGTWMVRTVAVPPWAASSGIASGPSRVGVLPGAGAAAVTE